MHLSVCPCSPTFPSCFLSMPPCKSFTHEICASIFCFMIPLISYRLALIKSVYKKIFYPIFVFFALNLCKYALPDIGFLFSNRSKKAPAEQCRGFFFYPITTLTCASLQEANNSDVIKAHPFKLTGFSLKSNVFTPCWT